MEIVVKQNNNHKISHYFTPKIVADFMIGLADIFANSKILEPSCGERVFGKFCNKKVATT
jgi:adenine-specific DNA-methyltransferase